MIFLDNASTTKPDKEIIDFFVENQKYFLNPGAIYSESIKISEKIEKTRKNIVKLLNGDDFGTFIFTGTSTEANNIVLNSVVSNNKNEEFIFSSLEHPSIHNIALDLLNKGRIVHFINSKTDGTIDEEHLYSLINSNTKFVSIINVSNEIGAVNNISKIAEKIKNINPKVLVHSDGVQALGKTKVDCSNLDFYTISSHKIYGLKGIAGFYCKNLKTLKPYTLGGGQEFNIRSGTTNPPMIFTFEKTIENAIKNLEQHHNYCKKLNLLFRKLIKNLENVVINSSNECVPNIISISILGLNAETILNALSAKQIYVGLGSACSSKKSGNRVLEVLNKTKPEILGNLRISFSKNTTTEELDIFYEELNSIVLNLREKLK